MKIVRRKFASALRYYRFMRLFLSIVWRRWDVLPDGSIYRLSVQTAWQVAGIVHLDWSKKINP